MLLLNYIPLIFYARLLCPWEFYRQEYWSGLPCPLPGDLSDSGIEPRSPTLQVDILLSEPPRKPLTVFNITHLFFLCYSRALQCLTSDFSLLCFKILLSIQLSHIKLPIFNKHLTYNMAISYKWYFQWKQCVSYIS